MVGEAALAGASDVVEDLVDLVVVGEEPDPALPVRPAS